MDDNGRVTHDPGAFPSNPPDCPCDDCRDWDDSQHLAEAREIWANPIPYALDMVLPDRNTSVCAACYNGHKGGSKEFSLQGGKVVRVRFYANARLSSGDPGAAVFRHVKKFFLHPRCALASARGEDVPDPQRGMNTHLMRLLAKEPTFGPRLGAIAGRDVPKKG